MKYFSIFRSFILKLTIALSIVYLSAITLSLAIVGILFLNLHKYEVKLQDYVLKTTNYKLNIGHIKPTLDFSLLPKIVIKDLQLIDPKNTTHAINMGQLQVVLSYSSIWHLQPIFKHISISNTSLSIEYVDQNTIFINGLKFFIPTVKERKFDFESWLFKQSLVELSNVNIKFESKSNYIPGLDLQNLNLKLTNSIFNRHKLFVQFNSLAHNQIIFAMLKFRGDKLTEVSKLDKATFRLFAVNTNNKISSLIVRYLGNWEFLNKLKLDAKLEAKVLKGQLEFFHATLGLRDLEYIINKDLVFKIIKLSGNIDIKRLVSGSYTFNAQNFTFLTYNGYIFNNESKAFTYNPKQNREINFSNIELSRFSPLLPIIFKSNKVALTGKISNLNISQVPATNNNSHIRLSFIANNVGLKSQDPNLPSFNHVNLSGIIESPVSTLKVNLTNSTIKLSQISYIPYEIKSLDAELNIVQESNSTFKISLAPTTISTPSFKADIRGNYIYRSKESSFIELSSKIGKLNIALVESYLPKQIGFKVHDWLRVSLKKGSATNSNLIVKGAIHEFPFTSESKGIFKVNARFSNVELHYLKDWPSIKNIDGNFQILNHKILIQVTKANVNGNIIKDATAIIPNMTHNQAFLKLNLHSVGSTANYLNYLAQSSLNDKIDKLPENTKAQGGGTLTLDLTLPFHDAESMSLKGNYKFNNNQVQFTHIPVPLVENLNGDLTFNHEGIEIPNLSAKVLNSKTSIKALTTSNHDIKFEANSHSLDFNKLVDYYLPILSPIVSGTSDANIKFTIKNKEGFDSLHVTTNLDKVKIDAPSPLKKESSYQANFTLNVKKEDSKSLLLTFNYRNNLLGNIFLDPKGGMNYGLINIHDKLLDVDSKPNYKMSPHTLVINARLKEVNFNDWLDTIQKLTTHTSLSNVESKELATDSTNINISDNKSQSHLNLKILLDTQNFYLGNTNFNQLTANVNVENTLTRFDFSGHKLKGRGIYYYQPKHLVLNLSHLYLAESKTTGFESSSNNLKSSVNPTSESNEANFGDEEILSNFESYFNFKNNLENLNNLTVDFESKYDNLQMQNSIKTKPLDLPKVDLNIESLNLYGQRLGALSLNARSHNSNLIIESGVFRSPSGVRIYFGGSTYCMNCLANRTFTIMNASLKTNDFGAFLESFNYQKIMSDGKARFNLMVKWPGKVQEFNFNSSISAIGLNIKNGRFLKVNTNNVLGQVLAIINLQTIVNIAKLKFSDIFANGFYFDDLTAKATIINSQINLEYLTMTGPLAVVLTYGKIDILQNSLNLYLSVTPKFGASFAIGAALAAANPLIGVATYGADYLLNHPINKLFAFSYHITGSLDKPVLTKVSLTTQILKNIDKAVTDNKLLQEIHKNKS